MINLEKKYTIVIAHPDDEVIFGWMVIKQATKIIAVVSDCQSTSSFPQYKQRKYALEEIGKLVDTPTICLDYNSGFYKLPEKEIEILKNTLAIVTKYSDIIFTHNEFGDYGHPDHVCLYNLIVLLNKKIVVSDAAFGKKVIGKHIGMYQNDLNFYERCHQIYLKYNCWTWNNPPITKATLIEKENV